MPDNDWQEISADQWQMLETAAGRGNVSELLADMTLRAFTHLCVHAVREMVRYLNAEHIEPMDLRTIDYALSLSINGSPPVATIEHRTSMIVTDLPPGGGDA